MTRSTDRDGGPWTMRCDRDGCGTRSEPRLTPPPLLEFVETGWFVAAVFGDRCPECVAAGLVPKVKRYDPGYPTTEAVTP